MYLHITSCSEFWMKAHCKKDEWHMHVSDFHKHHSATISVACIKITVFASENQGSYIPCLIWRILTYTMRIHSELKKISKSGKQSIIWLFKKKIKIPRSKIVPVGRNKNGILKEDWNWLSHAGFQLWEARR